MGIAIQKLFAQLLFWLYEFLDAIFEMFQVLCGITKVETDGSDSGQSILNIFLESSAVTKAFLLIFLVSILVVAVTTITSVVKNIVNVKGGERKPHSRTVGQGFGAIITTVVMAFMMIFGITMSNFVLKKVYDATAPNSDLSFSAQLFDLSVGKTYEYEGSEYSVVFIYNEFGEKIIEENPDDNSYYENGVAYKVERDSQGNIVYEEKRKLKTDENDNPIIKSGWYKDHSAAELDFSVMTPDKVFGVHKKTLGLFEDADKGYSVEPIVDMDSFNFWTAYLVVVVMLVAVIFSMLGLVKRIFDIVFLFITLPLLSATIPLDDGVRFKHWRETVISKVLLAYGAVLSVNVFLMIVPVINSMNFESLGWSAFVERLFRMFVMMGGAMAINGGQLLLARLIGTDASESREMANSARALLGGAMAASGIARGVKNAAVGGYNKYGRFQTGVLPGLARAGNVAGNLIGGQKYDNSRTASVMRTFGRYHGSGNPTMWLRNGKSTKSENPVPSVAAALSGNTSTQLNVGAPVSAENNVANKHQGLINDVLSGAKNDGAAYKPEKK